MGAQEPRRARKIIARRQPEEKLEEMRKTVDEKLQGTLKKRLGEILQARQRAVGKRPEGPGRDEEPGLGRWRLETCAGQREGVGHLGGGATRGHSRSDAHPEQYVKNVQTKENTSERVEFAVKLPGSKDDLGDSLLLLPSTLNFPPKTTSACRMPPTGRIKRRPRRVSTPYCARCENLPRRFSRSTSTRQPRPTLR